MTTMMLPPPVLVEDDASDRLVEAARNAATVAWDIETSGLDWRMERIATCQLYVPGSQIEIVRLGPSRPERLRQLLADGSVTKIFHHAMFDLRFMAYHWAVEPRSVACTKVAAKVCEFADTSLRGLTDRLLDVQLDKGERLSNWFAHELTADQLAYAARDVAYLPPLLDSLTERLQAMRRLDLARCCYDHIPTRVQIELLGLGDPFVY